MYMKTPAQRERAEQERKVMSDRGNQIYMNHTWYSI